VLGGSGVDGLVSIAIFVLGLAFGSFLNVCIYRIPRALESDQEDEAGDNGQEQPAWQEMVQNLAAWRSVAQPERSFCPSCEQRIRWHDNIPVVSWFVLRGRCRDCREPISFRYTAVELLTAVLFLAGYARFGLTLVLLKYCIFALLMVALIFTDYEHKLLPDAFTLPGLVLGLIFSWLVPLHDVASELLPGLLRHLPSWRVLSFADAVAGAFLGAAFIFGAGMIYKLVRGREGMGLGDVKLMAMAGAFLGVRLTVLTIFGGSVLGTLFALLLVPMVWYRRMRRRMARSREPARLARRRAWRSAKAMRYYAMPFGVFLGAIALLATFFGAALFRWYWTLSL